MCDVLSLFTFCLYWLNYFYTHVASESHGVILASRSIYIYCVNKTFYICIKLLKPCIIHWLLIFKLLINTVQPHRPTTKCTSPAVLPTSHKVTVKPVNEMCFFHFSHFNNYFPGYRLIESSNKKRALNCYLWFIIVY